MKFVYHHWHFRTNHCFFLSSHLNHARSCQLDGGHKHIALNLPRLILREKQNEIGPIAFSRRALVLTMPLVFAFLWAFTRGLDWIVAFPVTCFSRRPFLYYTAPHRADIHTQGSLCYAGMVEMSMLNCSIFPSGQETSMLLKVTGGSLSKWWDTERGK